MATRKGGTPSGFNIVSYKDALKPPKETQPTPAPVAKSPPPPPPPKAAVPPPPAATPSPPAPMPSQTTTGASPAPVLPQQQKAATSSSPPSEPKPLVKDKSWAKGKVMTIDDFKHVALFRGMNDNQIKILLHQADTLTLDSGDVVFEEGAKEQTLFLLQMGRCEISQAGRTMASLGAGTAFGEMALVSDHPRSATVTAVRLSTFKVWDPDTLLTVFDLDPEIGLFLFRNLSKILAQRLTRANVNHRNHSSGQREIKR